MQRLSGWITGLFLVFFGTGFLFATDNRFALVIGNGDYRDKSIAPLVNPVNDATDIAAALKDLGYSVTLKTNIGLREMIDVITDFAFDLKRSGENEGFFWYAGHGLSIKNIHYMLPVDVDPVNENIIARGSYSVDDLMDEIGSARNRTNLIVIDACRNTLLPGSSRTVGGRGLVMLASDDYRLAGNKVVYSTMAGKTASDGVPGSRNSPFAQAFIANIKKPEAFDDVFLDIASETMRLTHGEQQPYSMGNFAVKSYALNPLTPATQSAAAQTAPETTASPTIVYPAPQPVPQPFPVQTEKAKNANIRIDDARFWSVGGLLGTSFADPWLLGTIRGTIAPINYAFLELGADFGTFSGDKQVTGSYTVCPFIHIAYFRPINKIIGIYAGIGGAYMLAQYRFEGQDNWYGSSFFTADVVGGVNLFSMIDISYTIRTNLSRVGHKFTAGYTWRF